MKIKYSYIIVLACFFSLFLGIISHTYAQDNKYDTFTISLNPLARVNNTILLRDKLLDAVKLQNQKNEELKQNFYDTVKPNESGKIMIHMFHHFVPTYAGKDKKITITLDNFEGFLQFLYDNNYRPISMKDYLSGDIDLPAGCSPFLLTFDDGWASQFSFVLDDNGSMVVNPECAVYILQEFSKKYPDFETKGVFYVNLGADYFGTIGTEKERFEYLLNLGFEIGNHTYSHKNLAKCKTADDIVYEIGRNHNTYMELTEYKYEFTKSFALPYGITNKTFFEYFLYGTFDDTTYTYENVMLASGGPAVPVYHENYNPYKVPRLLAPGIENVYWDSDWWLQNINPNSLYISDGDPQTVTVPLHLTDQISTDKLNGKQLVTYELSTNK